MFHTSQGTKHRDSILLLTDKVIDIWKKSSIPTILKSSISVKIDRFICHVRKANKCKSRISKADLLESYKEIFDVCSCHCYDTINARNRSACECPAAKKIPAAEWNFWLDQKSERILYIGSIDTVESRRLSLRLQRNQSSSSQAAESSERNSPLKCISDQSSTSHSDNYFSPSESSGSDIPVYRNLNSYPLLAAAVNRTGISNRSAALIVNEALKGKLSWRIVDI